MAFKGDLRDINLADIFQTLAMNQQEGTLTIMSGENRTSIYFSGNGVRLLVSKEQKHLRLGELLLKKHKLTPIELDMALARQKMTGELLGQALIDMNVVTEEDIIETVHAQMEEDIHEVFSWKKAMFEFTPGEPTGEFYDPARMGNPIAFNVNSVIMEAARRIDEWGQIHKYVPHMSTIYLVTDPEAAIPDISHLGFPSGEILEILRLIDGRNTVEDVANQSPMGRFETCKIMAGLVEAGYLTKLDPEETIRIAEALYAEGEREGTIRIYKDALNEQPMNVSLRLRLAEIYEYEAMNVEASGEYARAGQLYLEHGSVEDGFALYRKATELAPKNYAIREKLFSHYCAAQKFEEAAAEGLVIARWYWRMNKLQEACRVLEQVAEMSPENVEAYQLLAGIYMDLDQPDKMLAKYEVLAEVLRKSGDEEKLTECYRKILSVEPKRGDIRNKLNTLLSKKKKTRRKGGRKVLYVLLAILLIVGGLAAYYVINEASAKADFRKIESEVDTALKEIPDNVTDPEVKQRIVLLRQKVEKWCDDHPYSLLVLRSTEPQELIDRLRALEEKISRNCEMRTQAKVEKNKRLFRDAGEVKRSGDYVKALGIYGKIDTKMVPELAEIIYKDVNLIRKYLDEAKALYDKALAYIKEHVSEQSDEFCKDCKLLVDGNILRIFDCKEKQCRVVIKDAVQKIEPELLQKVHKKLLKLLKEYKNSPLAKEVKLPLLVESVPSPADVEIAGVGEVVGQTPYVHFRKPGGGLLRVEVKKHGYKSPPFVTVTDSHWHAPPKEDTVKTFDGSEVKGCIIEETDNHVLTLTKLGKIQSIKKKDIKEIIYDPREKPFFKLEKWPVWTFKADGFIESDPVADDKKVYFGTRAGVVYAVDLKTGKKTWDFKPETAMHAFVASPMVALDKLYIGSFDSYLYALDTKHGVKLWSSRLGSIIRSTPSRPSEGGVFYIGCYDKKVYAIDSRDSNGQKQLWEFPTGGEVLSSPALKNNVVYVGSNDKNIYAIGAGTCQEIWSFKTLGHVTGKPSFYKDLVIFGSDDKAVYALHITPVLLPDQRRDAWTFPTDGAVASTPFVDGDLVYVTSGDGKLYCLKAATGKEKWSFDAGSQLSASPVVADGIVYFGSTDGHFYAVSAETHKEVWKYKTEDMILAGACVTSKYIIVGSTDSVLYCFTRD